MRASVQEPGENMAQTVTLNDRPALRVREDTYDPSTMSSKQSISYCEWIPRKGNVCMHVQSLSYVQLFVTSWPVACKQPIDFLRGVYFKTSVLGCPGLTFIHIVRQTERLVLVCLVETFLCSKFMTDKCLGIQIQSSLLCSPRQLSSEYNLNKKKCCLSEIITLFLLMTMMSILLGYGGRINFH